MFHVSSLRPWDGAGSYQPPSLSQVDEASWGWKVERVLSTRLNGSRRQYLVSWVGGGETWH